MDIRETLEAAYSDDTQAPESPTVASPAADVSADKPLDRPRDEIGRFAPKAETPEAAPRVTPADIEANIASVHYFIAAAAAGMPPLEGVDYIPPRAVGPLDLLTFCVLVLRNGFTVTGESACASPENFDAELGRKIARANAVNKMWPLMGYALKERLAG